MAEKSYLESHGNSDLDLITSLQAMHTGDSKKGPFQRANSPNPLHTKRMADGTAHVGKGAGGGISKRELRSRSRNRSSPYISPNNSRSNSRSPSDNRSNGDNRSKNLTTEPMNTNFQNPDSKSAPKESTQWRQFEGDDQSTPSFHRSGNDFNRSSSSYNTKYHRGGRGKRFFGNRGNYGRRGHFSQREQSPDYLFHEGQKHFGQQPQNHYQPPRFQSDNDRHPRQENQYWRSRDNRQNQPRFFNQGFRGRNRNFGNNQMQTFKQEFEVPETFQQTIQFDNICQLSSCRSGNGFVHTKSNCPYNRSGFR
jgi:hypothetical protein